MPVTCCNYYVCAELTVTGVVTEKATGYPAIGVSVLVKGTTNGTITSMDGDYTLNDVPKNATLVYSYGVCLQKKFR